MGTIDTVIKSEIVRRARREVRKFAAPLRDELKRQKKRDAERKVHIVSLERLVRKDQARECLSETVAKGRHRRRHGLVVAPPRADASEEARAVATAVRRAAGRDRDLDRQLGEGKAHPRPDMRAKILSLRGMKRREVKLIVADRSAKPPTPAPKKKGRAIVSKPISTARRRKAGAHSK